MQYISEKKESTTAVPIKATTDPIVTGSAIFALKYKDGVMMCTDTLASYGSMSMFKQVQKMHILSNNVIIGFNGEYSDFIDEARFRDDNSMMTTAATFNFLRAWLYQQRSKMEPLWNTLVVIGLEDNKPFLGIVDKLGSAYEENFTSTGYGLYFCLPLMRSLYHDNMTEDEARAALEECARVGYYRNCLSSNRIQLAKVTSEGCVISDSYKLETNWPV